MPVNAVDLVVKARRSLRHDYGPCAAANPSLVHATVRHLIIDRGLDASGTLMLEISDLLGTTDLNEEPDPA